MSDRPEYALSIKQPWADNILFEGKDIENRTWRLPAKMKGQCIYVHAGKKPDYAIPEHICAKDRFGAILGEVTIIGCVTESDSDWFEGPFGFLLSYPFAYAEPIPCKGALGFFKPRDLCGYSIKT